MANRLQRCVRFGRSLGFELSISRTRGTRVNCSAIEAVKNKVYSQFLGVWRKNWSKFNFMYWFAKLSRPQDGQGLKVNFWPIPKLSILRVLIDCQAGKLWIPIFLVLSVWLWQGYRTKVSRMWSSCSNLESIASINILYQLICLWKSLIWFNFTN